MSCNLNKDVPPSAPECDDSLRALEAEVAYLEGLAARQDELAASATNQRIRKYHETLSAVSWMEARTKKLLLEDLKKARIKPRD